MKRVETVRWDPEFSSEETEALEEFLADDDICPPDGYPYIGTKKEFLKLYVFWDDHFDEEDDDEVVTASLFASMLERIRDLKDDDILEISLEY